MSLRVTGDQSLYLDIYCYIWDNMHTGIVALVQGVATVHKTIITFV